MNTKKDITAFTMYQIHTSAKLKIKGGTATDDLIPFRL